MDNSDLPSVKIDWRQQVEACLLQGDYALSTNFCEQWLESEPDCKTAYWYLGLVYLLQGKEAEAQMTWMMVLAEAADAEELTHETQALIQVLQKEAEHQEAIESFQTAWLIRQHVREIEPTTINNLLNLVRLSIHLELFKMQDLQEWGIISLLNASIPVDAELLLNTLGKILGKTAEHPISLELAQSCLSYFAHTPNRLIEIFLPLATKLSLGMRNFQVAHYYADLSHQLDPYHSATLLRLSIICQDLQKYQQGIEYAEKYRDFSQTLFQKLMGNSLVLRGYMSAGADWLSAAALLRQQTVLLKELCAQPLIDTNSYVDASILTSPIFFYPYFQDSPQETRKLQNRVASYFQTSLQTYICTTFEDYTPTIISKVGNVKRQKLRIGYLSRSLRRHSVGWLCRWVFQYFDRDRFEVYAYFNQQLRLDEFTKRWFIEPSTCSCTFEGDILGIARAIREDEVDILIDLDSLTADLNCGVMALKPAPVQITWLGLDASGIPAIDYFIADPYVLPKHAQEYYSERIWRLPQTYIAVDGFEVGVPTIRRDHLNISADATIYLSSQFAYKRHPDTIRLQMQILEAVPNSYFLIKGLGDAAAIQQRFEQVAEEVGVACDRLRFLPRDPDEETHRANLGVADVVLDTFPYNGATTTLETLWMGIPIVTKVGQQFAARNSYTMMINAGITEGIAWTDEEYIEWGIRLGTDANLRQQISWKLRQSRQTAPLWNAQQFTREMEKAFEQMWNIYLQQ
jgi:predicted O-linked N-acetylglucosamine transferase (SPINDLY family)